MSTPNPYLGLKFQTVPRGGNSSVVNSIPNPPSTKGAIRPDLTGSQRTNPPTPRPAPSASMPTLWGPSSGRCSPSVKTMPAAPRNHTPRTRYLSASADSVATRMSRLSTSSGKKNAAEMAWRFGTCSAALEGDESRRSPRAISVSRIRLLFMLSQPPSHAGTKFFVFTPKSR